MLTIYGNKHSGNSNRVVYTAELLGLEYSFREMDFQKDLKTEWFLKIHPAGKVPALDDDGFALFESVAMCKYLCAKAAGGGGDAATASAALYPSGIRERALVDQWIDFSIQHVGGAMYKIMGAKVYGPLRGKPVDEAAVAEGQQFLDRFLPIIEAQLGKQGHLASGQLTLADVVLLSVLDAAKRAEVNLSGYPNLFAWRTKLQDMAFWKKAQAE